MLFKRILSKVLRDLWKFKYYYEKKKYSKTFDTFEEAKKFCKKNSSNKNYDNKLINILKVYEFENYSSDLIYNMDSHTLTYLECLYYYFRKFPNKVLKNILDIGGSTGIDALTLRDRFNISVKYNILENHTLVDLMKKKNYVHSNYFSNLDEFKSESQNSEIDFIYTRGTLHYLDKPYDLLEKMKSLNPKIIFLCNVNFGSKNEAYSEYSMFRHHIQGYTLGKLKNRNANLNDKILIPAHSLKLEKVKNIFYPEYKVFREYEVDGTQTNNNFCKNIYFQRI